MILLLGGTSETPVLAVRLAEAGYHVLVSRATDVPLEPGTHPNIECRSGPLDGRALAELLDRRAIRAIIVATHPYALAIRTTANRIAADKGIPCVSYVRPPVVCPDFPGVQLAVDHAAAAVAAFARASPVLLTTGSRNLGPYAEQAARTGVPLVVRILDHTQSWEACRLAGIPPQQIILGRGPFSIDSNRQHIRTFGIGVLVTKDSGVEGGTREKLDAAHAEGCDVIVVARPAIGGECPFSDIESLLTGLANAAVKPE